MKKINRSFLLFFFLAGGIVFLNAQSEINDKIPAFVCTDYTGGNVYIISTNGKIEWQYPADGLTSRTNTFFAQNIIRLVLIKIFFLAG